MRCRILRQLLEHYRERRSIRQARRLLPALERVLAEREDEAGFEGSLIAPAPDGAVASVAAGPNGSPRKEAR